LRKQKNEDKTVDTVFNIKKITIQDREVEDIYTKDDLIKLIKGALIARTQLEEENLLKNGKIEINI
jgi:predicted oxidoreductase